MALLFRTELRPLLLCFLLSVAGLATAAGPEDNFPPGGQIPLGWATSPGATTGWVVASEASNGGALSLRSSALPDDPTNPVKKTAAIEAAGNWSAGSVSFAYQVSSEAGFDFFEFYIDGVKLLSASGSVAWTTASFPVGAGAHVFKWAYAKDESNAVGSDAAWLDTVVLPPGSLSQLITVSLAGSGHGTIASDVGGIVCGPKCSADMPSNSVVTLTASTAPANRFAGWSGACTGTTPTCAVVMGGPKSATATFVPADDNFPPGGAMPAGWTTAPGANAGWAVASDSTQAGTYSLKSAPIADGQTAAIYFGAAVGAGTVDFAYRVSSEAFYDFLTLSIDTVPVFTASGDVSWTRASVPVSAGTHVFKFAYQKDPSVGVGSDAAWIDSVVLPGPTGQWLTVRGGGIGAGLVASVPGALNCGVSCAVSIATGTPVTLSAYPAGGSKFGSWGGACSGTSPTCVVTMDAAKTVIALFGIPGVVGPLDVDGSSPGTTYDPLSDGVILLRYLFGQTGPALTAGLLGATATRTDPAAIKAFLDANRAAFDVDGDGNVDALSDGLMILRYLFGLRGTQITAGAVSVQATRTPAAIEDYILSLMP